MTEISMTEIIVAFISGGLALLGVILSNRSSNKKIEQKIQISQAVTETKVDELTREVRKHNNFAERMPVVERELLALNSRIKELEKYHKEKL